MPARASSHRTFARPGLRRVDGLVVSHQDLDHAGGALACSTPCPSTWLASSLPPTMRSSARRVVRSVASPARQWTWNGVRFSILHPSAANTTTRTRKTNDRSCVVRIDSAHGSALLTGDIEARSEARLVAAQRRSLARRGAGRPASRLAHVVDARVRARGRSFHRASSDAATAIASVIRAPTSSRAYTNLGILVAAHRPRRRAHARVRRARSACAACPHARSERATGSTRRSRRQALD
jgi:hypothetical protein